MTSLIAGLWLAAVPLPAQAQKEESWSEGKYSSAQIKADAELVEIQRRIERGDLPKIGFDLDSDRIRPESRPVLDMIADVLLKSPNVKIRISAHTCILGAKEHNLDLSERRAKAVKTYLVKQGVPPPSIRFRGWGSEQPIADNSTEEGRSLNRRVEFRVIRESWNSVY